MAWCCWSRVPGEAKHGDDRAYPYLACSGGCTRREGANASAAAGPVCGGGAPPAGLRRRSTDAATLQTTLPAAVGASREAANARGGAAASPSTFAVHADAGAGPAETGRD